MEGAGTPILIVNIQGTAPVKPGQADTLIVERRLINKLKAKGIGTEGGYIQGIKPVAFDIYSKRQDYPYEREKPVEGAEGALPGEMRRTTGPRSKKDDDQPQPKRPWRGVDVWFWVRFHINLEDPSKEVVYKEATKKTGQPWAGMGGGR